MSLLNLLLTLRKPIQASYKHTLRLYRLKPALFLLLYVFVLFTPGVIASERLERLDDLKVTDVKAFKQQLAEFESKTDSLSSSELGYLQLLQGYNMTLSGDFNGAQKHLEFLLHQQLEPEILFRVKAMLINVQAITQNYRSAFTLLQEITQQLPDIDNVRAKEHGLSVIAYTYNQLEQFATAKFYAQMLLDIAVSERARCHANHHLLESLHGQSDWAMFHALLEPAIAHCLQFNEQVFANLIRIKQHSYLLSIGAVQKAETYYQTYKDEVHNIGYPLLIASAAALAARTAVKLGKIDTALSLADIALSHQDTNQFSLPLINTYTALSEAHEANQDYKSALYFQTKLRDALKANSDNRFAQQQAYYLARAEVDVKNQRITLLDKDNQVLVLQRDLYEQDAQQNRLLVLVLGAIVLLASVLAYRGIAGRYRFKKIAEYDQLTGISNRYHFNKQARLALQYCEQNAKPVAVILFDLDHFKQINDLYGHAAGDWALQAVVKTCRNFMRNNDVFGRIGGEEFAVLLPGCQTDKAALLAEICRDAIASIDSRDSGFDFPLTASFGVSGSGTSGYILKQLLSDADNAMYQAKAAGRNRVMAFSN